ncbi:hypothetical protein LX36DRAFT_673888 [Colletotrichum falcatum]|nr:hypothetical protein LX36DRAFT_673888 [Colletotrichum falcatum]
MRPMPVALLLAPAVALPIAPRQVNISPQVNPAVGSSSPAVDCVGIAVCNPVTVDDGNGSPALSGQAKQTAPVPQQAGSGGGGGSLINVAPAVGPSVNLPGLLNCVGVAACNPVSASLLGVKQCSARVALSGLLRYPGNLLSK